MRFKKYFSITSVMIMTISLLSISVYAWKTEEEGPYRKGQNLTTIYSIKIDENGNENIIEQNVYLKTTEFKNRNQEKANGKTWYLEKPVCMYKDMPELELGYLKVCFMSDEVSDAETKGWIREENYKIKIYNPNGDSLNCQIVEAQEMLKNGWYLYPVKILYKLNGNSKIVKLEESYSMLKNGWYEFPACLLYSPLGVETIVKLEEKDEFLENGYLENIDGFKILYALDGRQELVKIDDVDAQLSVGWYLEPVVVIYNDYGDESLVFEYELDYYRENGWYAGDDKKVLYSLDGREEEVSGKDVQAQLAVGWYAIPVTTVYAADGRSLIIPQNELEAYKNVGWDNKIVYLYLADGRCAMVPEIQMLSYQSDKLRTTKEYWMEVGEYLEYKVNNDKANPHDVVNSYFDQFLKDQGYTPKRYKEAFYECVSLYGGIDYAPLNYTLKDKAYELMIACITFGEYKYSDAYRIIEDIFG